MQNQPIDFELHELSPGENELAGALSSLLPIAPRVNIFEIQALSMVRRANRRTRIWQVVAAALAMSTALIWQFRPPAHVPEIVQHHVDDLIPDSKAERIGSKGPDVPFSQINESGTWRTADLDYLTLRSRILMQGVNALGMPALTSPVGPLQSILSVNPTQAVPTPWYLNMLATKG